MIGEYDSISDLTGLDRNGFDRGKSVHIYMNENQDNLRCKLTLISKDQNEKILI